MNEGQPCWHMYAMCAEFIWQLPSVLRLIGKPECELLLSISANLAEHATAFIKLVMTYKSKLLCPTRGHFLPDPNMRPPNIQKQPNGDHQQR